MNFRCIYIVFWLQLGIPWVTAQQLPLETALANTIKESSGLLFINNTLITHNDSGGSNVLYEVDIVDGSILRTVSITNATNVDWEDIAADDTYIYIGDIGNNFGSRIDLKVYRILITDFFNANSVTADIINYSYFDQVDFTPNPGPVFTTDYDAEALISFNGKLYIFTKQWTSQRSSVYELPITPGTYELNPIDTIDSNGLVTGASRNTTNSAVLLSGYSSTLSPFIVELQGFSNGLFSNGTLLKTGVSAPDMFSSQIEGITAYSSNAFYLSSEAFITTSAGLYTYTSSTLGIDALFQPSNLFYPNPTNEWLYLHDKVRQVQIFNMSGQLLIQQNNPLKIYVGDLSRGVYQLVLLDNDTASTRSSRLVVN